MSKWVVHCKRDPYDVYIGRPGTWGNPFKGERMEAIRKHREWLLAQPELVEKCKQELKGKVLGCWCAPKPCHGDTLAEIANQTLQTASAQEASEKYREMFGGEG